MKTRQESAEFAGAPCLSTRKRSASNAHLTCALSGPRRLLYLILRQTARPHGVIKVEMIVLEIPYTDVGGAELQLPRDRIIKGRRVLHPLERCWAREEQVSVKSHIE